MVRDISEWLEDLGLSRYAEVFCRKRDRSRGPFVLELPLLIDHAELHERAALGQTESFPERGAEGSGWRENATLRRELLAIQCQAQANLGKHLGARAIARIATSLDLDYDRLRSGFGPRPDEHPEFACALKPRRRSFTPLGTESNGCTDKIAKAPTHP